MSQWTDLEAARVKLVEVEQRKDLDKDTKEKMIGSLKKEISNLEVETAKMERISDQSKPPVF